MKKHFITFYSPGTFVPEETTREVESWDVEAARRIAGEIVERHGAKPFGFRFSTSERGDDDFNPKETARSGMYYLGGKVRTLADVEADNDPKEETLRWNMRNNDIERVVTNTNSWKYTGQLRDGDTVLDTEAIPS
jgi:hypothetical protein